MNEPSVVQRGSIAVLESLAQQARMCIQNVRANIIQLGRIFTEAKKHEPHGGFKKWVEDNTGFSQRQAEYFMKVAERYGDSDRFSQLETSKLIKLLALPEGTEDDFSEKYDPKEMTAREVEKAVKAYKEQLAQKQSEIDELKTAPMVIPVEVTDKLRAQQQTISDQRTEIARIGETARSAMENANAARAEAREKSTELAENNALIDALQAQYNEAKKELQDIKRAQARGESSRPKAERMSYSDFAAAVQTFMGTAAILPNMSDDFREMDNREYRQYRKLVDTVRDWCVRAENAMNTIEVSVHG